ncbi:MAG: hypothetical protein ABIZ50_06160 [Solirubrobacterales bacterium]
MQPHLFHTKAGSPAARLAAATGFLVAVCALVLLLGGKQADASIAARQDALAGVQDKQAAVADQIAAGNEQINNLIGQVSEARQREEAATAELATAEDELAAAEKDLVDGRNHLQDVREQLQSAVDELEKILVGVYKSDDPDMVKLLLESTNWEDASVDAAYLDRVHQYQANTIQRVTDLRTEAADTVDRLADAKQRIEEQRDAIAERQQQLADVRASLESQEAELAAARADRRQTLAALTGREDSLQSGISRAERRTAPPPIPEVSDPSVAAPSASVPAPSGSTASLNSDGSATAPADAPPQVVSAIAAANAIRDMPYVWGGGHGSFESSGYDCSGAVSYALNGGGFLDTPLDSTGLGYWGEAGAGSWITVYANAGHTYVVIAGLRWDTSGTGGSGPSWSTSLDGYLDPSAYTVRHPAGF